MYRCEVCEELFEELALVGDNGIVHRGCPNCGSDMWTELDACDACKDEFPVDELFYGLCADCLRKKCTYDKALAYLKERGNLGSFFCWHVNEGFEPEMFAEEFLDMLEEIFLRKKANDLLTGSTNFLGVVQYYILDADGDCGKDDFAKFLFEGRTTK